MEPGRPISPLFQYLLAELHGARTTVLALVSSVLSSSALIVTLLAVRLTCFAILPGILFAFSASLVPVYVGYLNSIKSVVKGYGTGELVTDLSQAYRDWIKPKEPRLPLFRRLYQST